MAVTRDEILAGGAGPVRQQQTWAWANQDTPRETPGPPRVSNSEDTGIETVSYDTATNEGAPDNAKNAREVVERGVVNVANPIDRRSQPETDKEHVIAVGDRQKGNETVAPRMSYVQLFERMSPYKPPTDEDLEKERKRQKREAVFAAIGEGISAMSNLYFTTQYAPNAFDATSGMAATTKTRFDKLKKEREANQREYMEGYLRAMKMDADAAREDRNYKHTLERERLTDRYKEAADARAQAKADRDAAMAELRMELMQGRIDQQEAAARAKEIEAEYADAYWKSRINKNNYRSVRSGSGGATKKYPVFNAEGDVIDHVHTRDEAVSETERNGGTYPGQTTDRASTQKNGLRKETSETSTTTTPSAGRSPREGVKEPEQDGGSSGSGSKQKKKTNVKWK